MQVYYYSYIARYEVFNVSQGTTFSLEAPGGYLELQYAEWGPVGSQLIFVHQNNIYYYAKMGDNLNKLVKTGKENAIFNGIPDWLYGEKILKTNKAVWWSADGNKLSFASFDVSRVDKMIYTKYNAPQFDNPDYLYPELVELRYPKAGRPNPQVSIWISDLSDPSNIAAPTRARPPSEIVGRDHYFTALSWIDKEKLAIVWMSREQNYSVVSLCSAEKNWICEKVPSHLEVSVDSDSNGWVELFEPPLITDDRRHYLLRLPMKDGELGAFRQIAMITINEKIQNFITQGSQDIIKILAHHQETRTVYYSATLPGAPGERHIFSIPDIHSRSPRIPYCLTCNQTDRNCSYHDAVFSRKAKFYILECQGPGVPWTEIRSAQDNQILMKTKVDSKLFEIVEKRAFPQIRSFRVPIDHGYFAEVKLILPPALREYEEIKFPLVVEIGSEIGDQQVSRKLSIDWGLYLASKRNFIYARIDVRGTRHQGDKFLHEIWHHVGTVEIGDYLKVIHYLKSDLHFIDPYRTAIWGWAYGGYAAATSLIYEDNQVFNCSILVAPITNWLFVDSFTAERYFGQPFRGSYINYERADLSKKVSKFKGKNLFILHGTADDAVHLQHSFTLMKALNDAGIVYQTQLYPDSNHYLEDVRYHLYRSMELYLFECFGYDEDEDIIERQTAITKRFGK
ncbi:prolyl endopeptidase FAP-like protein [Dinothrombium tinctorium]|uniref:Venom dipeptidyl peptidase 4 n=1 Tax=Dinothrombium tinctorium TaxID=1965070 RepID=A0A3S3PJF8_9ACAR|nr:prolyl endopeptidase FAP-like protein [Dinothrombium tinctorium]